MRMNPKTATLDEIENKAMELMGTPYGHNMIGALINITTERFGEDKAKFLKTLI